MHTTLTIEDGTFRKLKIGSQTTAMAIERGATVCSANHDFKRFPGVHHVEPLA